MFFYIVLMGVLALAAWRILTRKNDRIEAIKAFKERPFYNLFMIAWIGSVTLFVVGLFAPVVGRTEFFQTGLQLWQVGGLATLVGFFVSQNID